MRKLLKYLKDFRKQVFLGPLFKLVEAIFELIIPTLIAKIIDVGVKNNDVGYVLKMGGLMAVLYFVGLGTSFVCQKYAAEASQGVGTRLRDAMFQKIMSFSHAETDKFGADTLITRTTADVNQLQLAVAMLIRLVVRAPFLVIGSIIMSMFIDLQLSIVFLVMAPVVGLAVFIIMGKSIPFFRVLQTKLDKISLIAGETLSGARVIRAFSKQKEEAKKAEEASDDYAKTAMRVERISSLLNPTTFLIMNISIIAIIWFGGVNVNTGRLTQGQVVAFVNYLTQILIALLVVANLVIIFTRAAASATRVNEVLDTVPSVTDAGNKVKTIQIEKADPVLSFAHVDFAYPDAGANALTDIDFSIYPGESVGIIGGTGSGKSTLINLIPRFYDVQAGHVKIFGIDVKEYPLAQLRNIVSMVSQNTSLFSGSIRSNLSLRKEDASDADLENALRISQSAEFVSNLPEGLDTPVFEGGKNFSGGQRQRLTIARALVGQPKILILDDASSALDYATDAKLRNALAEDKDIICRIMVSQRANSIKNADVILVLDEGLLCGIGTHAELLKTCSVYYEICKSQSVITEEVAS